MDPSHHESLVRQKNGFKLLLGNRISIEEQTWKCAILRGSLSTGGT